MEEDSFLMDVTCFSSPVTAHLWLEKKDLLFIGEEKGGLHIY